MIPEVLGPLAERGGGPAARLRRDRPGSGGWAALVL